MASVRDPRKTAASRFLKLRLLCGNHGLVCRRHSLGALRRAVSHHRTGIDHGPPGDSIFYRTRSGLFGGTEKLELARPLWHRHLPFLFCLGIIVPRIRLFRPFCFGPLRDSRHSDFRMAHPGNLEKTSALEPICRLFVYDLGLSAPRRNTLFRMESLPRRACLRNGRDWLDLTEHDGPGFPRP